MRDSDFRTRQVLADLGRVAGAGLATDPWAAAFDPDIRPKALWPALAALLHLSIEVGEADPVLAGLWQRHRRAIATAPAPIRAALMQGVLHLRDLGLLDLADAPGPADLVTTPLRQLAPPLIAIARRMTPEERDHVARADYGCDAARHRAALEVLLAHPEVAYPPGEFWYPAEVVELVSHVPGQPGHVPCLAIVLLDALRTGDQRGDAEFRLQQQFAEIAGLDPPVRDAFFAAFRHLYESVPHWSPSVPEPLFLP